MGLAALADSIYAPQGTLLVFNPLSWRRSGLVEIDLDKTLELVANGAELKPRRMKFSWRGSRIAMSAFWRKRCRPSAIRRTV